MFKNIFIKLCNERGVAPTAVCNEIGLSAATFSCWTDDSVPRKTTLYKLADYFGVTVDYLLGKEETRPEEPPITMYQEPGKISMVPVYESVSAGFGSLAVDEIVDYIPYVFKIKQEAKESLFIRVRGDSMYPKIEDGDIILVHKQGSVESGSIAVVLVDGEEGLVKRVVYGDGWIELQSINPMYMPRRFNGRDMDRVKILGAVRKITKDA